MMTAPRTLVQMLCLLSYLWASSCLANVLQLQQVGLEQHIQIIVDQNSEALIVHHQGHRDQHEPQALGIHSDGDGDHDQVIKLACVHPDLAALSTKAAFDHALAADVLLGYLPSVSVSYTFLAKNLLLAQGPPPPTVSPPASRNSSIAIIQLTQLRI
jgi:hypothetical protein